jgi:hypothetical protein
MPTPSTALLIWLLGVTAFAADAPFYGQVEIRSGEE